MEKKLENPTSPKKHQKEDKEANGPTAKIRRVVQGVKKKKKNAGTEKRVKEVLGSINKKDMRTLTEASLGKYFNAQELKPYQAELIKLQNHLESTGQKMIIIFDGRDASGKGGTIRRVTRYMNEKHYRVIALGKPNDQQKTELHMKRYIEHFPHAGQIVLFDRSWYNRAMVEPVMGFCTPQQYRQFMNKVLDYESGFMIDGKTVLLKLYFSVSKEEQAKRFERRLNDPLRQWKLSEVDIQAQEKWDEFTDAKFKLLQKTHSDASPWYIIRSDDKQLARLETMKLILSKVRYRGRARKLNFELDSDVVVVGDQELKNMKMQRRKYGKFEY